MRAPGLAGVDSAMGQRVFFSHKQTVKSLSSPEPLWAHSKFLLVGNANLREKTTKCIHIQRAYCTALCPTGRLRGPWRHSRPGWMWLWAAWSNGWQLCPLQEG